MPFCTNCGNLESDGVKFCTSCGSVMEDNSSEQPVQQQPIRQEQAQSVQQPIQQAPVYAAPAPVTPTVYKEEPISTGGYIGIMLLLAIPVINLLCLIIWACGGCSKVNKRNFARAVLFWMLIGIIISGLIFLAITWLFSDEIKALKESLLQLTEGFDYKNFSVIDQ